ncbi:zf-HC2 domain-containing protein [Amycolatopsis rhabdoformis]|uniref:Zf-HC2 domain-containing protein n=1 Tax=Amycolatopsis rhabdoformis TaxID=1448059 RepID=A0ABZ1IFA2_9PSEU|nr:zf-HC2 domain-containing protein [Amycolatopsis rhabdoformis]WSE32140.1 zf-HC2 domain-containing protein [Amycolatopsis rhabdoformis]
MDCSDLREALSARIDGEDPGLPDDVLDRHVAGCPACRAWVERASALRRVTLIREAPRVPDLTERILTEVPAPDPARWGLRLALAVVALVQSGLGLAELMGADVGHAEHGGLVAAVHLGNESGAWNVAVGIGLLWAALRPSAASGLLPTLSGFVVLLGIMSGLDLASGQVSAGRVVSHGLIVIGVGLLYAVHRAEKSRAPAPPSADGLPEPGDTRTSSGPVEGPASTRPRRRSFPHRPTGHRAA